MIIQITCTEEEYKNTIKGTSIDKLRIDEIKLTKQRIMPIDLRLRFMKQYMKEGMRVEVLFRKLRTKGYSNNRKTLQRDLEVLNEEGYCNTELSRGNTSGTYAIINNIKKSST